MARTAGAAADGSDDDEQVRGLGQAGQWTGPRATASTLEKGAPATKRGSVLSSATYLLRTNEYSAQLSN